MSITKKTSIDILKRGSLTGINAALTTFKDLYDATDNIETRLADLEDGTISFAEHITSATQSTSTATGALIVDGGVGIVKDVYIGGTVNIATDLNVTGIEILSSPTRYSSTAVITAFAGGGQASATALTTEFNNVTTVTTAGDSVKLPGATVGAHIHVKNSGATALDIFPATADSIDNLAVNLAIRIQPGSSVDFYAKTSVVWESNVDQSFTLVAPTTNKGQLEVKAADSAGNTVTTITNASQAADRIYTIPDAGQDANFLMTEGTQSINGAKDFQDPLILSVGAVATPSVGIGAADTGLYLVSATQTGFTQDGVLVATFDGSGITADSVRNRVNLGTAGSGAVSVVEYANGKDVTAVLTLTNFVVGALAGAAANLGIGNKVYTFPAGQHFELVYSLSSIVLTAAGTAVNTDTGLGSVIASGAVAVLSGTATFEDRLTGQTIATAPTGGAAASALTAATAGIGTGISLNLAASVKDVFLNSAGAWNADNTGNLTATGTVVLKWTRMQ